MASSFQLDPYVILGVSANASLEQLRDAFREKSKKHHPDHGGDEWAFRLVVHAYDVLKARARSTIRPPESPVRPPAGPPPGIDPEHIRPGVRDANYEPERMVDVEMLCIRYEFDPADLFESARPEDRTLSGSLHIAWPIRDLEDYAEGLAGREEAIDLLIDALDALQVQSRPTASRSWSERGRFIAWLSYPSAIRASKAFKTLHALLNQRGFGVNQWTRDLVVPRNHG